MSAAVTGRQLRIGLTGGICSGKSQAETAFRDLGVTVIDTDVLAREVVRPGSEGLKRIVATFGPGVLTAQGELDRQQLRQLIFADSNSKEALEAILHPLIRHSMLARADSAPGPCVVLAIPLLFEAGWQDLVDRTLLIDCPEDLQLARLQQRDGVSAEQAQANLDNQMTRQQRIARADDCILNDGSIDQLTAQIERQYQEYLRLAQSH